MIIAFYNTRRGVGTTALAVHTCALARDLGLRVAGASVGWGHELEMRLTALHIPCVDLGQGCTSSFDLTVVDVSADWEPALVPDVWALPICDAASAEHACALSDRLPGSVIWIGNKGYTITDVPVYLRGAVMVARAMPQSRALAQAHATACVVWNNPELATSAGAAALRTALEDVLDRAYRSIGTSLVHAVLLAKARTMLSQATDTSASPEGPPPAATTSPRAIDLDLQLLASFIATLDVQAPSQGPSPEVPAEAPLPSCPPAHGEPPASQPACLVEDPGLLELVAHVRAELATPWDPKAGWGTRDPSPRTLLAARTARLTVDAWLSALHREGRALACGLRTANALADALRPDAEVASKAGLHPQTITRFKDQPGHRSLETLVRIAIAMGREDLLEIRHAAASEAEPVPASVPWPSRSASLHSVN